MRFINKENIKRSAEFLNIPVVWIGFALWGVAFGMLALGMTGWPLYVVLGLLLVDKILMLGQLYTSIAKIKYLGLQMERIITTQMMEQEVMVKTMRGKKLPGSDEEL
jgi:hypothetical protein